MKKKLIVIIAIVAAVVVTGAVVLGITLSNREVTVTFNANGGYFADEATEKTVTLKKGDAVSPVQSPEKDGHTFEYWALDGEAYDFSLKVKEDMTLTAVYKEIPISAGTVTLTEGEGFTYLGAESGEYQGGDKITFTVDVDAFYAGTPNVYVNESPITPDSEGKYSFTVNGNTVVNVTGIAADRSSMMGIGTEDSPYFIARPIDWVYVAEQVNAGNPAYVNAYYQLDADLDFKGHEIPIVGDGKTDASYFGGYVNGMGYTLSNFVINSTDSQFVGLFGRVICDLNNPHYGIINNINLKNYVINASLPEEADAILTVGSIVGYGMGCNILVCSAENGEINVNGSTTNYASYVGGIIGVQETIYDTTYEARFQSSVTYVSADVDVYANAGTVLFGGGIAGFIYSADPYAVGYITNCYSTGEVAGTVYSGGIVGCLGRYGSVSNCYSTGDVSAQTELIDEYYFPEYCHAYAGGIVGYAENDTVVATSFATGGTYAYAKLGGSYAQTGGTIGGCKPAEVVAQECLSYKNVYAEGGKDTANGVDLTDGSYISEALGWQAHDWVMEAGKYPTFNYEGSDVSFNVTMDFNGYIVNEGDSFVVTIDNTFVPMAFLYINGHAPEYTAADSGEISYGYYFDKELTVKVPASYVITGDVTLYTAFADYSEVAGEYLIDTGNSAETVILTLKDDGIFTYNDGRSLAQSVYFYNGQYVIFTGARFGRYSNGDISERLALYDFYAEITADGLKIYDGTIFTESHPLTAVSDFGITATYYLGDKSYAFYADYTGIITEGGNSYPFTYKTTEGGATLTVGASTVSCSFADGKMTVGTDEYVAADAYKGVWDKSATVNKRYVFDGMGNWSYEYFGYDRTSGRATKKVYDTASGTYYVDGDGKAQLDNGKTAYFDEDGALKIEDSLATQTYFRQHSYMGEWRDNVNGATIYLFGITKGGTGAGLINYDNGYYFVIDYSLEGADNTLTVYSGSDYFGNFSYDAASDTITALLYNYNTMEIDLTHNLFRVDDLVGEWVTELPAFSIVSFNGFGSYDADYYGINGYVEINGEFVEYTLENSTQSGSFTYKGVRYEVSFNEDTGVITVTYGEDQTGELLRKDDFAGYTYFDGNGATYVFDGRGKLASGGKLTVTKDGTSKDYKYLVRADGVEVYSGSDKVGSISVVSNAYVYTPVSGNAETLLAKTEYTGEWVISGAYDTVTIGGMDVNGTFAGRYLGRGVTLTLGDGYLILDNMGVNLYVFVYDGELVISATDVVGYGEYSFCAQADELFGTWTQTTGLKQSVKFDGISSSDYVYGNAVLFKGDASTEYYYRKGAKDEYILWTKEAQGGAILTRKIVWCEKTERGAYVNGDKAFMLVEVDALCNIDATDEDGVVWSFDGEGNVVLSSGEQYSYELESNESGVYTVLITDGQENSFYVYVDYSDATDIKITKD